MNMIDKINIYIMTIYQLNMDICLKIQNFNNKRFVKIMFLLMSPILLIRGVWAILFGKTIGRIINLRKNKEESRLTFDDDLSIVLIVKNEATYIREFIEFHKIVGVSKFYIYDNESTDNLKETIQDYIEAGLVVYTYYPGKKKQLMAYNDAIKKYAMKSKYMAFIDADEFIMPVVENKSVTELLDFIFNKYDACGLAMNWCVYGSSGHITKPAGLVCENYLYHAVDDGGPNYHIKTVCNPRRVKNFISPHYPIYKNWGWNIDEVGNRVDGWRTWNKFGKRNLLRLNHYFCKSREEAQKKQDRGLADRVGKYDWSKFELYDQNDVYDTSMLRYVEDIKKGVEK